MKTTSLVQIIITVIFILFWLYVIYVKLSDFREFKKEMNNQVLPKNVEAILPYLLPVLWFSIAALLINEKTRFMAMLLNFIILLAFSIYVGLAVAETYRYTPCSCAGLFDFDWNQQLYFNLIVTAVAGTGLIFTYKDRERRKAVWTR